jgi:predicted transcriptional regulator
MSKLLVFVKERTGISRTQLSNIVGLSQATVNNMLYEENERVVERMRKEGRIE